MKLSTQTDIIAARLGDEAAVRILAAAGYDCIDWSFFPMRNTEGPWCQDDWREHALTMRALQDELGITANQAHAPFPTLLDEEPYDSTVWNWIIRSMEVSSILGVRNIVVHPIHHIPYAKNKKLLWDMNVELYRKLIPYCEKFNIHVCAENMWQYDNDRGCIIDSVCSTPEEFCALLDEVNSPWIVGCLDIGHCALVGQDPAEFIRAMGPDRLKALHVHDVDYKQDNHTMPFMQKLDWESVFAALGEIGYTGDLTFEADNFLRPFPTELLPDAAALMVKTGRYLISRAEANRK